MTYSLNIKIGTLRQLPHICEDGDDIYIDETVLPQFEGLREKLVSYIYEYDKDDNISEIQNIELRIHHDYVEFDCIVKGFTRSFSGYHHGDYWHPPEYDDVDDEPFEELLELDGKVDEEDASIMDELTLGEVVTFFRDHPKIEDGLREHLDRFYD